MLHVAWKVVGYDDKESMDKIKDVSVKIENDDPKEVARQIVNQTDVERRGGPMMTETLVYRPGHQLRLHVQKHEEPVGHAAAAGLATAAADDAVNPLQFQVQFMFLSPVVNCVI